MIKYVFVLVICFSNKSVTRKYLYKSKVSLCNFWKKLPLLAFLSTECYEQINKIQYNIYAVYSGMVLKLELIFMDRTIHRVNTPRGKR